MAGCWLFVAGRAVPRAPGWGNSTLLKGTAVSLTRRQISLAGLAALPLALSSMGTAEASQRHRTLYIAGDSTAAQKYAGAAPETGWGMALPFFLHQQMPVEAEELRR